MLSPNEVVKEVAKLLSDDKLCYVHRASRKITAIAFADLDNPEIKEQISLLEQKIEQYIKVPQMSTQKLLFVMNDFLTEVIDQGIRKELKNGLNRKKPTRNFLQVVESDFGVKQNWLRFKAEQNLEYVKDVFIDDYNY